MKKVQKEKQCNLYNKGITLISLVITIIVLIILAGVSINLVLGKNGLFTKAREAREKFLKAQEEEEARIAELEMEIKDNENLPKNTTETLAGTQVRLPSKWITTIAAEYSTKDGKKVKNEVKIANVRAIATGDGKEVPVPKGFYYVGGTIESGVVISDNIKDQNKYANYEPTEGEEGIPAGIVYDLATGIPKTESQLTEDEKKIVIFGNQFVWIPVTENEYKKTSWGSNYQNATYETQPHSSELVQIKKYGGFYVGRYEAGTSEIKLSTGVDFSVANTAIAWINDDFSIRDNLSNHTVTGKITSKAGEIPYYHADYYTASKLCDSMYQTDYVQSGLVTGTMWDAIMKFIAGENTSILTTKSTWGNYNADTGIKYTVGQGRYAEVNSSNGAMTTAFQISNEKYHYGIRTTASTEGVKQKNLYDIAGNLWEWTQEIAYVSATECYLLRGGSFNGAYSSFPACYRIGGTATNTRAGNGFRPVLYIM